MASKERSKKEPPSKAAMQTTDDYESCATQLKALADPDRLRIITNLLKRPESVTGLADELGVAVDKVSHHLGVLRAANLVQTQKQGKFVIYSLAPEVAAGSCGSKETKTIDLGCCQLDLMQPKMPGRPSRDNRR